MFQKQLLTLKIGRLEWDSEDKRISDPASFDGAVFRKR